MSNWFNQTHTPAPADTTVLTQTFLAMDAILSRVQDEVQDYRTFAGKNDLDGVWSRIRSQCDAAIVAYMALVSPESTPTDPAVQNCAVMLQAAVLALEDFQDGNSRFLSLGASEKARVAAEAEKARQRALQAQQEAARVAAELPGKARQALSSISTRIQAARNRLAEVPAARSTLLREYPAGCSADLTGCEDRARELLQQALDGLSQARTAQQNDPARALELAGLIRTALAQADELIDAVPDRLRAVRDIQADPMAVSSRVRFKLHDAQMYAVDHNRVADYGMVLDHQLRRIECLEKEVFTTCHPDYWAYQNGLNEVMDSIQAAVAKMRRG